MMSLYAPTGRPLALRAGGALLISSWLVLPGCVVDRTGQSQLAAGEREMMRTQERVSALEDRFTSEIHSASQELSTVRKDSEQNQLNLANSEALMDELLAQNAATSGNLERLQRRVADLEADQERLQSNLDFQLAEYDRRLAALEKWARQVDAELGVVTSGEASAPGTPGADAGAEGEEGGLTSAETVERARSAVANGKPRIAIKMLKGFDKRFPDAPEAEEARFLYAQALRDDGRGPDAIAAYQSIIEGFPKSPRIPEAMLALGVTLQDLGETEEAKFFLDELIRIYPDSREAKEAKTRLSGEKK